MNELFIKRLDEIFLLEEEDAVNPFRDSYLSTLSEKTGSTYIHPDKIYRAGSSIGTFTYDIKNKKLYVRNKPEDTHYDIIKDMSGVTSVPAQLMALQAAEKRTDLINGRIGHLDGELYVTLWEPQHKQLLRGESRWMRKPETLKALVQKLEKEYNIGAAIWPISFNRTYTTTEIKSGDFDSYGGVDPSTDKTQSVRAGVHVMPPGKTKSALMNKFGKGDGRYSGRPLPKDMTQAEYRFLTTTESLDED